MANVTLGIKKCTDPTVSNPVRDIFCDGITLVQVPGWDVSDYLKLFTTYGLTPVKPETIRGSSKDQLKQLFMTKYFYKFENSGGLFDFKMESILDSVAKALFKAYPEDMKDNQHFTDEQYFGVRHKQTAILSLGITKLDLARDYAAFLYMKPEKFSRIIAGI